MAKDFYFSLRDHADIKAVISGYAREQRLSMAEAYRRFVRAGLETYGLWPPDESTKKTKQDQPDAK